MRGYNVSDEYMYFKLGAYTQNNTGEGRDYDQVTVYSFQNLHNSVRGAGDIKIGNSGGGNNSSPYVKRSVEFDAGSAKSCLLYTSPSPRDLSTSRMPSSA